MRSKSQRGSALIIAVIILVVVTLIGVGVIRFASRGVAGARAGANQQALVACAEAARGLLYSKFHALGLNPTAIAAINLPIDGSSSSARTRVLGGHYDEMGITVSQVVPLPPTVKGPGGISEDLTNRIIAGSTKMGKPFRVIVHCQDRGDGTATSGRQLEVEFGVNFGL
jgi:hypothetical protein